MMVSKEVFWRFMMTTRWHVHPYPLPDRIVWKDLSDRRRVVAITTPGYRCEGPATYDLRVDTAELLRRLDLH